MVSSRIPANVVAEVDGWAAENETTRSHAIRRLVELGLTVKARPKQAPHARAERAKELAAKVIDKLTPDAGTEEKASRKYRLLKGPEEFREARVDRTKKK